MQHTIDGTTSAWEQPETPLAPLRENTTADVVVVGAGIAGLSVAYELALTGVKVVVLDDGPIGGGETGRTTAHLVTAVDNRYFEIEKMHGAERARMTAESHGAAISRMEAIVCNERIDCDFRRVDGYLFVPAGRHTEAGALVRRELEAAARAGLAVAVEERAPGVAVDTGPCLRFPAQAQFHPLRYLEGLARGARARGGHIFTGSHASDIKGGAHPLVTTGEGFQVACGAVVVATNTPVCDRLAIHTKQVAYRSYVIGCRVPKGGVPVALYWDGFWDDTAVPYHYARLRGSADEGHELLIVGGEDHAVGRAHDFEERYARLEAWTREHFPTAGAVEFRWSGQIMEPHDELAYIGRDPGLEDNLYIVTGDSGNGMTHAAIAGILIPRLMAGKAHPWKEMYAPSRLPTHALGTMVSETVEMAGTYRDWVAPHGKKQLEDLAAGEGVVVRVKGHLCAVCRGKDGRVSTCSAICPHLYGVVRWNASEQSWDCPCHGSRFDRDGRVINGPANADLAQRANPEPTDFARQEEPPLVQTPVGLSPPTVA